MKSISLHSRRMALTLFVSAFGLASSLACASTLTENEQSAFTAKVSLEFANGVTKTIALKSHLGNVLTISSDEGGMPFALTGTVTKNPSGKFDLRAEVKQYGSTVATPHLVASNGLASRIRVGEKDATGEFHGTTVSLTLSDA